VRSIAQMLAAMFCFAVVDALAKSPWRSLELTHYCSPKLTLRS
jgi:hypothetical protein